MPPYDAHVFDITRVIQLAIAPVFMLTAVASIINALLGRLARAVDRLGEDQPGAGVLAAARLEQHRLGGGEVLLEQQRRERQGLGAVVEAVADVVGGEGGGRMQIEAEQVARRGHGGDDLDLRRDGRPRGGARRASALRVRGRCGQAAECECGGEEE